MFSKTFRWSWVPLFVLTLLSLPSVFAAEPPKITLAPTWRPGTTLDSVDTAPLGTWNAGDDFRYVDVDIYITTTVQFWSVQMTCTASPAALTSYESAAAVGDPNNDTPPVIWGSAWGVDGNDYFQYTEPYNPTTGARTFTASRLGNRYPMGGANGTRDIFLLATLRYRAKDIAANTTATFTCTSTFLNRSGNPVLVATYTPPPPLSVITGYVASGTVLYQGRTNHAGITVSCDYWGNNNPLDDINILTTATGAWTKTTRNQGYYTCQFYGDTVVPATLGYKEDRYLAAATNFELTGLSYNMLPVTLRGGNLSTTPDGTVGERNESISMVDIVMITAAGVWNKTSPTGDVNGDGKSDQKDLTIATSNFDYRDLNRDQHIIYNIPRDYDVWRHSRVWVGPVDAGATTALLVTPAGNVKDMWATVSPDGKQLAFIRNIVDELANTPEMGLYVAPIVNSIAGTPTLITPVNADYYALAPSWSPDGTRIAFVCSWYDDGASNNGITTGYMVDEGYLCLIDANGRNFRNFSQVFNVWEKAKTRIYPPAWLTSTDVLFGGAWGNEVCENKLCLANLQYNDFRNFDDDVLTGGTGPFKLADMPVVRGDRLFYRFYDQNGNNHTIRWAQITWTFSGPGIEAHEARAGSVAPYHMTVDFDADGDDPGTVYNPLTQDAGYFTVSRVDNNIIYVSEVNSMVWRSHIRTHDLDGRPEWDWPFSYYVDDMVDNPVPPINHTPYTGGDNDPGTPFYAHRNTFEWLP